MKEDRTELLFSYGTLQREEIQLATFGRKLQGERDVLTGYRLGQVAIQDPQVIASSGETHYRNLEATGAAADRIEGTVFAVTGKELEQSDVYEAEADYERIRVGLQSGTQAWVYLQRRA
jgi:gamma-glutamylcyclotransferase (GGCT)/AIG2-like uncharacterized protein YtfP